MYTNSKNLLANGKDFAHIEMQVKGFKGNPVYLADNEIHISITGPGEIIVNTRSNKLQGPNVDILVNK